MRSNILNLLRRHPGEYLSGADIARQLAVSRTAIWKHIQELKNEGYAIDAHSRRGYSLRQTPDLLLPEEIRAVLQTRILGHKIYYFTQVDSTNNEAKKLAVNGAPEGTIVVSESQNGGRGRMARAWFDPRDKGIAVSVILRPHFSPQDAPKCTLMAAVATVKAIEKTCQVRCGIKWPNDILYEGKKLVGILTEVSVAELDAINHVVIGTGINVNIEPEDFPEELRKTATSLAIIAGSKVSRIKLLGEFLLQLEELYQTAETAGFSVILNEWRKYSVTLGQTVNVIGVNRQFTGQAVDIDEDGALLVDTDNGREKVIAGDVSIRPAIG